MNLLRMSSEERVCKFSQQSFTKNWQNWFSWTKSRQWTPTVCLNIAKYLAFLSSYAAKRTILLLAKSPRKVEKVIGILCSWVRHIVKRDLRQNVFRRKKAQLLSDADHQKRVKCCKTLLRWWWQCWQCLVLWREDIHGPTTNQYRKLWHVCCSK